MRDKKQTFYCYSEEERQNAIKKLKGKPEITRFKGLGEISPDEFGRFISPSGIRLKPVILNKDTSIPKLLHYYMGKNTGDRQRFIIDNLRIEQDLVEDIEADINGEASGSSGQNQTEPAKAGSS